MWIRLHYLYPDSFTDELIDEIAANKKILKYLDIPIQHINDGILKRMNRRGTGDDIRTLFRKLRESIPKVVLRTSLITGLPGEGEAEFGELVEFLKEAKIERAGVFAYSPEEGTPAVLMERPDAETAQRRAEQVEMLQSRIMDDFNTRRQGKLVKVLLEGVEDGRLYGRSYAESPDVDGVVYVRSTKSNIANVEIGEIYSVMIMGSDGGDVVGELIGEYNEPS